MKKAITFLAAVLLMMSLAACGGGSTETASADSKTEETTASVDTAETTSESESVAENAEPTNDVSIDQIEYSVGEEIDDGERDVFMQCANNSPYTISGIEITFVEKSDVTEEQKEEFYADLKDKYEMSDEDIEELKEREISMHVESEKLIPSGEKIGKIHLYYYSGYYYMRNLAHYDLVEPDIATIKYVKDGKIYTEYYDYQSDSYSMDDDVEEAYAWGTSSPLAELVSKPDVEVCKVDFDREDVFWFYAFGCSLDDYKAYVEDCKAKGFTVDADDFDDSYYAYDEDGNRISIRYDDEDGSISVDIDAADEASEAESTQEIEEAAEPQGEETESADGSEAGTVFEPQDVSDATIESINTYGDYLVMYRMIVDDYLANYESVIKGTVLYDESTFQEMKDDMDEEFKEQEEEYGSMKNTPIVGKDTLVDYLKTYRDTLQSMVDSYADMVEALP